MTDHKFSYRRGRGIVWVCDLADSSKRLNDNATAAELETFLPRLHWLAMTVVQAAGGTFIKWTGDGFLAWFETPLHRELSQKAQSLFEAIWHLTFTVNVTQLATSPSKNFRLRHGVAFEHDALLTTITHSSGYEGLDITGRAVVLAFRLSGIPADFPNLVTDRAVAKAAKDGGFGHITIKAWTPKPQDLLRYFKGERWGTTGLAISAPYRPRKKSLQSVVRQSKKIVSGIEAKDPAPLAANAFVTQFTNAMQHGPDWAREAMATEARFLSNDMLGTLKSFIEHTSSTKQPPMGNGRK